MRPIVAILPLLHADVRPIAGQAGTVDHRAVLDHEVVGIVGILPLANWERSCTRAPHSRKCAARTTGARAPARSERPSRPRCPAPCACACPRSLVPLPLYFAVPRQASRAANDNTSRKECTRTNRLSRFAARCLGCAPRAPAHAQASAYPSKTIRMVIALAPGGGIDTTGRFIGTRVDPDLGSDRGRRQSAQAGGAIAADCRRRRRPMATPS